jgi:hypothetical protein
MTMIINAQVPPYPLYTLYIPLYTLYIPYIIRPF